MFCIHIKKSFFILNYRNPEDTLFCFLVERCILNFQRNHDEICPNHSSVSPMYMLSMEGLARTLHIAPDAVSMLFRDGLTRTLNITPDVVHKMFCFGSKIILTFFFIVVIILSHWPWLILFILWIWKYNFWNSDKNEWFYVMILILISNWRFSMTLTEVLWLARQIL